VVGRLRSYCGCFSKYESPRFCLAWLLEHRLAVVSSRHVAAVGLLVAFGHLVCCGSVELGVMWT
jgi:hypothetical protein